jgi:hypothetical protein
VPNTIASIIRSTRPAEVAERMSKWYQEHKAERAEYYQKYKARWVEYRRRTADKFFATHGYLLV